MIGYFAPDYVHSTCACIIRVRATVPTPAPFTPAMLVRRHEVIRNYRYGIPFRQLIIRKYRYVTRIPWDRM
jgi:hypothetical protein